MGCGLDSSTSLWVPPTLGHQNCLLSHPKPILCGLGLEVWDSPKRVGLCPDSSHWINEGVLQADSLLSPWPWALWSGLVPLSILLRKLFSVARLPEQNIPWSIVSTSEVSSQSVSPLKHQASLPTSHSFLWQVVDLKDGYGSQADKALSRGAT